MSDIILTTRTLRFLSLRLGERRVEERDGLIIPVMVNRDGPLLVSITDAGHISCKPHVELINGVRYDVAWWFAVEGGNPHGRKTSRGYRCRAMRVQRVGSDWPSDHTDAAHRLAIRLTDEVVETVTNDVDVMREAEIVTAERLVISRQVDYDRALAALHKAETALRAAEATWDRLSDGDVLATVGPGEAAPAIAAGIVDEERRSA